MRTYLKQICWTAVLAAATAFGQTPPEPPQTPATPPAEAPETPEAPPTPRTRVRPPRPPKIAKGPNTFAYAFSNDESGSYLGVGVRDVTHDMMAQLNLREERGVEVTSIDSEGPAAKAGLKEQDVILTFNGENVESYEQLRRMIHETPPGRKVKLGISRAGRPLTLEVALGKREEWSAIRPNVIIPKIEIPPMNFEWDTPGFAVLQISSRSGATVEDLTPQLGDFFGAKNGEGVLVRSVERGSPAETAGLKAGDVILRVGTDRISNSSEWRRYMRQHRSGAIPLTILRDRREQTLSLKLPERRSSDAAYDFEFPNIDIPTYNAAEIENLIKQVQPDLERTRVALANLKVNQKQFARDLERSMKQMQRELERQQKEMLKEHQD